MIRPATPQDLNFITDLAHAAFNRFGPYIQVFEDMLLGNQAALKRQGVPGEVELFIYQDDAGQPNGFIAVEWEKGGVKGNIHGVAVDELKRGQGLATQLLECVIICASERGVMYLECITAETHNAPALSFFMKNGFENQGYQGNYPKGQRAVRLLRTFRGEPFE
jgi:ribosomal protein S18 acetylase RimI-like enzyme